MENTANRAELCGSFVTLPALSHENYGQKFYHFFLEVERLSGISDILRVIVPEKVLYQTELDTGAMLYVRGQVRSFHEHTPLGRRLRIFVYGDYLECRDTEALNDINLIGSLCKAPIYRKTPLGREICDLMLSVPRSYGRYDFLPIIAWGRTARMAAELEIGNQLELYGRLQSREYRKTTADGTQTHTAYEISILSAQPLEDVSQIIPENSESRGNISLISSSNKYL